MDRPSVAISVVSLLVRSNAAFFFLRTLRQSLKMVRSFSRLSGSSPGPQTAVELPPARYGKGVNDLTSVIVTVAERGGPGSALVYLGERVGGKLLPDDPTVQEEQITQAVQDGFNNGKLTVLLKAERDVLHRDVSRVAAAAGQVEGIRLHLAVLEIQ